MKTLSKSNQFQDFALTIKFHGATNTKGSRVSINSKHFNKKITLSWDYSKGCSTLDQVAEHLIENNIDVIAYSEQPKDYIVLVAWEDGKRLFNIV